MATEMDLWVNLVARTGLGWAVTAAFAGRNEKISDVVDPVISLIANPFCLARRQPLSD